MAGQLERIFSLLLSPDTETIRQGTAELQSLYKNPILLEGLCHVILNSENPHIRQLSAVVLRKKLVQVWRQLSQENRESLKNVFVQCLSNEMHHLVLRAAANLVSVIANFEFTHNQWPELSVFIMQNCQNDDPVRQEIGMLVLSSVMETAASQLHPQYIQLLTLFSSALSNERNKMVPYYALKSLTSMIEYLKEDEMPHFRTLIPKALQAIKALISEDEVSDPLYFDVDKACNAMELFDELMECDISLISPFIRQLVEFCLEIGNDLNLDEPIRVKALSTLGFLATVKKKSLLKLNLLSSILQTTLSIMATAQNDESDDDDDILSDHTHSPQAEASRVLDQLALNLPPEKMFTSVLGYIQPWLQNECLPLQKRAALTAIGVISEGCAEYIRKTHLSGLVQFIYSGLEHPDQHVKNAALFSLGQFSEHLQPEISQFSSDLLPALFQFLDHALTSSGCGGPSINRTFYAVEMFCENLGANLLPYLPVLMDKLFLLLTGDYNFNCKELAISCIGAIANAVGEGLVPYFQKILESLKMYLMLPYQQDMIVLQAQAVDTLGTMARTMGVSNFRPIAEECVQLGMSLINSGDPDLRRSVYGMLASVSKVLSQDMVQHLPTIIPRMIESLSCDEGIQAYYSSFAVPFLDFDDEPGGGDESIDSLEDDQDIEGYTVENAYIEEKEDTCNAIAEIAENVGILFLPYIDDCFKEIRTLVDHSAISIRKASVMSLGRLLIVWYHPVIMAGYNEEEKTSLNMLINFTLNNMSASARTDSVSTVVLATLDSIETILKGLKGRGCVLERTVVESLVVTVEDILNNKAQCQEDDGEGTTFEFQNSDVAEIDGLLLETAGSIIGPLATGVGGANIMKLLKPIVELLMNKLTHDSSVATRSFVIGTFAEIVDGCGSASSELAGDLYPLFTQGMSDKSDEVASNSVYGIGTLAANALPVMASQYPEILSGLFGLAQTRHNGRLMDNICAAVCRMITSQQERVPLEQVLPVLLQNLPLKEDMEENETVYNCVFNLLSTGNIAIMNNLDLVLKAFATELSSDKLPSDLRSQMIQILLALHAQCSQQFEAAIACLPPGYTQILVETLASQTGLPNTNDNI